MYIFVFELNMAGFGKQGPISGFRAYIGFKTIRLDKQLRVKISEVWFMEKKTYYKSLNRHKTNLIRGLIGCTAIKSICACSVHTCISVQSAYLTGRSNSPALPCPTQLSAIGQFSWCSHVTWAQVRDSLHLLVMFGHPATNFAPCLARHLHPNSCHTGPTRVLLSGPSLWPFVCSGWFFTLRR